MFKLITLLIVLLAAADHAAADPVAGPTCKKYGHAIANPMYPSPLYTAVRKNLDRICRLFFFHSGLNLTDVSTLPTMYPADQKLPCR
jgi:hypothetical protein